MNHKQKPQWACKASVDLSAGADMVWSIMADFFNLHKWLPTIGECLPIEGTSGEVGCVRYVGTSTGAVDKNGKVIVNWAKEKLISIDNSARSFAYEITDNNLGYKSYQATMRVIPKENGTGPGCKLEWSLVVDPVEGRTQKNMSSLQNILLKALAMNIDKAHREKRTQQRTLCRY